MLWPFKILLIIANIVSKIGIAKTSNGINKDVIVTFLNPRRAITAIINPKNMEPESPAKMVAGLKLWTKNPKVEPNITKVKTQSKLSLPWIAAIIPMVKN